jgi:hypothetical protein
MNILSLISAEFEKIKVALLLGLKKCSKSEFSDEVYLIINNTDHESIYFDGKIARMCKDFMFEFDGGNYLMRAAVWYNFGMSCLKHEDIEGALECLGYSNIAIGSIIGISDLRSENAKKSNKEHIELRREAIEYWRNNIEISMSDAKAAEILAKQFPVSTRKLASYVSEEKKRLRRVAELPKQLANLFRSQAEEVELMMKKRRDDYFRQIE